MRWKYHLPHYWEIGQRKVWDDVYILPDDPDYKGDSLFVTVDGLSESRLEILPERKAQLGKQPFWIAENKTYMIVNAQDFNKEELIIWLTLFLQDSGLPVSGLLEAPFEEFANTNEHARLLNHFKESFIKSGR